MDGHGIAGVERFFNDRLHDDPEPLRLSLDVRVQAVLRDELSKSIDEFTAIGGCGIVMDVRTGEVIAMVSLPDYDANKAAQATPEERFNRAVTGMYEPGSTFKLQTAGMALDSGAAQLWSSFDAAHDIHIGRFTITDFEGKKRFLELPEVLAYSSNLGAAHMAQAVGGERQRAWLGNMGMFERIGVELPEAGRPIFPALSNWGEAANLTVGFGHGIAVSPLHVVRGTAALANGGVVLRPTVLAQEPGSTPREGVRIMQQQTSDTIRKLMRLGGDGRLWQARRHPRLFRRRQDRHGREGRRPWLQEAHQRQRLHERVPDERAALRGCISCWTSRTATRARAATPPPAPSVRLPPGASSPRSRRCWGCCTDTAEIPAISAALSIPLQPGRGYVSHWIGPLNFVPPSTPLASMGVPVAGAPRGADGAAGPAR